MDIKTIIELHVKWLGECRQKELVGEQVSNATASRKMRQAIESSDWLALSTRGRAVASREPELGEDDVRQALLALEVDAASETVAGTKKIKQIFHDVPFYNFEHLLEPPISPQVLQAIFRSFYQKKAIEVVYFSKRQESEFLFTPGAIIKIGGRYHVRGWHHRYEEYRDLVISRIRDASLSDQSAVNLSTRDVLGKDEYLEFEVNPDLDQAEQISLDVEWASRKGEDGTILVKCRKSVAKYVCALMSRVHTSSGKRNWIEKK